MEPKETLLVEGVNFRASGVEERGGFNIDRSKFACIGADLERCCSAVTVVCLLRLFKILNVSDGVERVVALVTSTSRGR